MLEPRALELVGAVAVPPADGLVGVAEPPADGWPLAEPQADGWPLW
jgi:hypothetical protein